MAAYLALDLLLVRKPPVVNLGYYFIGVVLTALADSATRGSKPGTQRDRESD